eukprot:GILJ01021567.1.p1 GENE.GILJ01021567.1~~GILJ01021567.1.p1  ORF type:complete len:480 (+),score=23.64 GILJ01021567.1:674-2113(+)
MPTRSDEDKIRQFIVGTFAGGQGFGIPCASTDSWTQIRILTSSGVPPHGLSDRERRMCELAKRQWEYITSHESFYMAAEVLLNSAGCDPTILLTELIASAYRNNILLIKYVVDQCNMEMVHDKSEGPLLLAVMAGYESLLSDRTSVTVVDSASQGPARPQRWRHIIPLLPGQDEFVGISPRNLIDLTRPNPALREDLFQAQKLLPQPLPLAVYDPTTFELCTSESSTSHCLSLQRLCGLRMLLKSGVNVNGHRHGTTPLSLAMDLVGVELAEVILNRRLAGVSRQQELIDKYTALVEKVQLINPDALVSCPLPTLYEPIKYHIQTCDVNAQRGTEGGTALHKLVDGILQSEKSRTTALSKPPSGSTGLYPPKYECYTYQQLHLYDLLSLLVAEFRCDLSSQVGGCTAIERLEFGMQPHGGTVFAVDCLNMLQFFFISCDRRGLQLDCILAAVSVLSTSKRFFIDSHAAYIPLTQPLQLS